MVIIVSSHARARMRLRNVSEEMIRETVQHPDSTDTGYTSRSIAYKKFGSLYLKVVYFTKGDVYHIITVIMQSRI